MKYFLILILLAFVSGCDREFFLDSNEDNTFTGSELKGKISGILTRDGSPYRVIEDIYIDTLTALSVEAGVKFEFNKNTRFVVKGILIAKGDLNNPVIFTSKDTSWGGIGIYNSPKTELNFCVIENINSEFNDSVNGAIEIISSSVILKNNLIGNNRSINGGGIFVSSSFTEIFNNILLKNFSIVFGGAILSENSSNEIINNTFVDNRSSNFGGGIILGPGGKNIIINNIFYKNSGRTGNPGIDIYGNDPPVIDSSYNFFFYNSNPGFFSESDFHLQAGSTLVNKGNPAAEFNDADGTRNDPGAYGGPSGNW